MPSINRTKLDQAVTDMRNAMYWLGLQLDAIANPNSTKLNANGSLDRSTADQQISAVQTSLYYMGIFQGRMAAADSVTVTPDPASGVTTVQINSVTVGSGTVQINYTLVVGTDGAAGATRGRNGNDTTGAGPWTSPYVAGTTGNVLFDKLINGTAYVFTIQPKNAAGTSVGTAKTVTATPNGSTNPPPPPPPTGTTGAWKSGIVGEGDYNGQVAAWRGRPLTSATHWADSPDAAQNQWGLQPGGAAAWVPAGMVMIDAIGGVYAGQSWAQAASGALDGQWTNTLNALKEWWPKGPNGTTRQMSDLIISFAHEANGHWYDWKLRANELNDWKIAWHRFRQLQQQIIPAAKVAIVVNADHVPENGGYTMAQMLPNSVDYDYFGFDMYEMHFGLNNFDALVALGAQAGKPIVIQEWATANDNVAFVQYIWDNLVQHGGTGVGKVEVENYFNLWPGYHIFPTNTTESPNAAAKYAQLW